MSGVCILGIALGVVGSNLVDAQEAMANKAEDMLMKQVMSVFDARAGSGILRPEDLEEEDARREEEMIRHPSLIRSTLSFFRSYLPLLAIMLGMAYWIGHRAGWSLLEIFYYTIITSTTVGKITRRPLCVVSLKEMKYL